MNSIKHNQTGTTLLSQAKEFRDAYSIPNSPNGNLTQKSLIDEEWSEFHEAFHLKDEHEQLKELCDLVYVCYQFAANEGWDLDEAMDRVHKSNMSKLDENGQPIYREDGKVLKGPNYKPPNLTDLLNV
jgi:predicted HAD superfamily Cof-like phosphohydrolase